jgi:hypothetical protein
MVGRRRRRHLGEARARRWALASLEMSRRLLRMSRMGRIHSLVGPGCASDMANLTCPFQARVTAARPAIHILNTTCPILNASKCRSSHNRSQRQSTLVLTSGCSGGLWLFQPPQSQSSALTVLFPPLFTSTSINQPNNRNHAFRNGQ